MLVKLLNCLLFVETIDNGRYGILDFKIELDTMLHGFAGYFECTLYNDVTLSKLIHHVACMRILCEFAEFSASILEHK